MRINFTFLWRAWYSVTRLMRWEDYTTFLQLVFGFLLVKSFRITLSDISLLTEALIILAPLLYGGIYALNDVMDAHKDKLNSIKKHRPIPKGYISRNKAFLFALLLIASAGIGAMLLSNVKLQIAVIAFLFVNMFYTFVAKHIPYLELFVNAVTHPMRIFFGAWFAGGSLPVELVIVWFIGSFTGSVFRRIKEFSEKNERARPVMKYYSRTSLTILYSIGIVSCFAIGIVSLGHTRILALLWGIALLGMYIGYYKSIHIRRFIEFAWQ